MFAVEAVMLVIVMLIVLLLCYCVFGDWSCHRVSCHWMKWFQLPCHCEDVDVVVAHS